MPEADEGGQLDRVVQAVRVSGRGGRGGRGGRAVPRGQQAVELAAARLVVEQEDELVLAAGDGVFGHCKHTISPWSADLSSSGQAAAAALTPFERLRVQISFGVRGVERLGKRRLVA